MSCSRLAWVPIAICLAWVPAGPATAQFEDSQQNLPDPVPPPLPPRPVPEDAALYEPIVPESDLPWGLPAEMLAALREKVELYDEYTRRFTCDETARLADYDSTGEVSKEKIRRYGYLLVTGPRGEQFRESRREFTKDGKLKSVEVEDIEPFPPAYMWIFMFSEFHAPYFQFRLIDTRFDGFDRVHEIQFRGSLPFTTGKDIRQWEGKLLVDAFTYTPLEIIAEPTGQREKLRAIYSAWNQSFSILGFRTKPRPLGYRASIQFRLRKNQLTFPTELRYDTNRAVSASELVAVKASTRTYDDYFFFDARAQPTIGDVVRP